MKKYPSIEKFANVVKYVEKNNYSMPTVEYTGRVKLHGTNAGIRYYNGEFIPQCRSRHLINGDDNMGFASFVNAMSRNLLSMMFYDVFGYDPINNVNQNLNLTIFGEWIGKGIQGSKIGIGKLDKQFVVLTAYVASDELFFPTNNIGDGYKNRGVLGLRHIPHYNITIDFNKPHDSLERLEQLTTEVEECCPYAKYYGHEGIGEGIVWHPTLDPSHKEMWFKTKGEKHSGKYNKIKIEIDPVVEENIIKLVDKILPEWRLQQGIEILKENKQDIVMQNIGHYLKWINIDTQKEEALTIEASELEWSQIVKVITRRAKLYFVAESEIKQ